MPRHHRKERNQCGERPIKTIKFVQPVFCAVPVCTVPVCVPVVRQSFFLPVVCSQPVVATGSIIVGYQACC